MPHDNHVTIVLVSLQLQAHIEYFELWINNTQIVTERVNSGGLAIHVNSRTIKLD